MGEDKKCQIFNTLIFLSRFFAKWKVVSVHTVKISSVDYICNETENENWQWLVNCATLSDISSRSFNFLSNGERENCVNLQFTKIEKKRLVIWDENCTNVNAVKNQLTYALTNLSFFLFPRSNCVKLIFFESKILSSTDLKSTDWRK